MPKSKSVSDLHISHSNVLPAPEYLCQDINPTEDITDFVSESRNVIHNILFGNDPRVLAIVGPCSIHDPEGGIEYAKRLAKLSEKVKDRIYIVMRVYFEKPRTTVGWKGLIMDPDLDDSANIPKGLKIARQFLLDVLNINLPTATELLDPITPQYIADLISWSAIGARTTESQTHRQMASGLSMPLGFKNGTSGDIVVAINAIKAASQPQTFLGISHQGLASAVSTKGNPSCHLILRGGSDGPNFDEVSVSKAREALQKAGVSNAIILDCSHANSNKDPNLQPEVLEKIIPQLSTRPSPIVGFMLESNLTGGNQSLSKGKDSLEFGKSITDGCIDWETTEKSILATYDSLASRFK